MGRHNHQATSVYVWPWLQHGCRKVLVSSVSTSHVVYEVWAGVCAELSTGSAQDFPQDGGLGILLSIGPAPMVGWGA